MRLTLAVLSLVLLGLATGCGGDDGSDPSQLVDKQWQLVSGEGITLSEGVDAQPSAAFNADGGEMGFVDGCNQYRGYYTLDGNSLKILDVASTLEACPQPPDEPRDEMARAYGAALGKVASWGIEDEQLVLSDADGNELLRYEVVVY